MKALKDQKIVCGCGKPLGCFRGDVADEETISSNKLVFDLGMTSFTDADRKGYKCRSCSSIVAVYDADAWTVIHEGRAIK